MEIKCWNCGNTAFTIKQEQYENGQEHYVAVCDRCKTRFDLHTGEL
jgi:Zn finger protein HypA/HybF involved in hydrogenase expression